MRWRLNGLTVFARCAFAFFDGRRRADALHLLERPGHLARLRRVADRRRRVADDGVRLHEPELGGGVRHPDRPRQQHRAGRPRSRPADAFLSAPQPVPLHHQGAEGLRRQRDHLDAEDARQGREGLRVAQERLHDRQPGDLDRGRRRLRQPARRAAHQHPAGAEGGRRQAAQRESGNAADALGVREGPRQHPVPARPRRIADTHRHRQRAVPSSILHCARERTRPAAVLDRLSRPRRGRDVQPRPDEDVDRHARVRELAVVAAVLHPRAAARQQMDHAGDVQRSQAPTCCAPSPATARSSPTTT